MKTFYLLAVSALLPKFFTTVLRHDLGLGRCPDLDPILDEITAI